MKQTAPENSPENDLLNLLKWYGEVGVDEALAAKPANWFAQFQPKPPPALQPAPPRPAAPPQQAGGSPAPGNAAPMPTDTALMSARQEAAAARSMQELEETLMRFDGCALKATARNTCFYRGNPEARVMLIGEAPGRDEDLQGKPFVGRAGQLLDKMLAAIDLSEDDVYITNIIYWRPPGNRTPTPQEAQICRPFLERQIALLNPDLIILLGGAAAKHVLGTTEGIMRLRGKWRKFTSTEDGSKYRAIATLHPAYLLRTPIGKRLAWRDLLAVREALAKSESE